MIIGLTGQFSDLNFDKEIMEAFVLMGFLSFSKFPFVSNLVSLYALKVWLLEYKKSKSGCFHPENVHQ